MEAVNQLASTLILCSLVIGWLGIWLMLSGLAILVYRIIKLAEMPLGVLR